MIELDRLRREEFPVTQQGIYLDHATFGPPPSRHVRAASELIARMSTDGLRDLFSVGEEGVDQVRSTAAQLLRCRADSVFFARSTSQGVGLVAEGVEWRDGDEVVVYELDHPAGVLPWLNLARRGVRVRFLRDRGRYGFDGDDLRAVIGPRTKAVSLSLVNFGHGGRAPVEEAAELCRARDVWLVVDAVQALGALAVDAPALRADVVVAHGYKFLLSGFGIGLCYCSDRALSELEVRQVGWKSVRDPFSVDRILDFRLDLAAGAKRFEASFQPLPQVFGMGASLDLFLEAGPEAIEERVLSLAGRLVDGLLSRGYQVVGSQASAARSPIISVALPGEAQAARMRGACARHQVACAVRESRLRLSPHFYNTEAELDRLLNDL
jgi:cysteine desulfurase/selenocysteine lyase